MNRTLALLVLTLVLTGVGLCAASRPADEAAIKSQLEGYAAARTVGEGSAQAMFYTEDGDEWGSAAREMTQGRAELAKTLNVAPDPKRRFKVQPIHYTFLGNDTALVDANYFGVNPEPAGHGLYVMVKQKGKWLIRSARITRYPPAPAK